MKKNFKGKNLRSIFRLKFILAVMIICLITLSIVSYFSIKEHAHFNQKIYNNTKILFEIESIVSDLVDIETSYRGYLLTGDQSYLEPYQNSMQSLNSNFVQLQNSTASNYIFSVQLEELRRLLDKQVEILSLDRIKQIPDSLFQESVKAIIEEENMIMGEIRLHSDKLKNYQLQILNKTRLLSENITKQNYLLIAIFILLTAIILFLAYISIFKELERSQALSNKLEESIHRLSRSNEELEQFAYVASHDLQEPLRKLIAFSDIIKEKYVGSLPSGGLDYFNRIIKSSDRMQTLIQDLLNFSRVSKNIEDKVKINIETVIQEAIDDLQEVIRSKDAKINIKVQKKLYVEGIPFQIRQLFQNLISNALKFNKKDEKPVIKIFSRIVSSGYIESELPLVTSEKYIEIAIKDNGIGFDEKYLSKIFTIFQRIHGRNEYSGTGIGLALCKKITENHKGVLIAESSPGKGATFTVYLPLLNNL